MTELAHPESSQKLANGHFNYRPRHPLDKLKALGAAKHLLLARPSGNDLDRLLDKTKEHIPGLADISIVQRVLAHNSDCVWTIARRSTNGEPKAPEGLVAMLPLTATGLDRLVANDFNGSNPDLTLVCRPGERPAGIYIWAIFALGRLAPGFVLFTEQLEREPYAGVDMYTRTVTPEGKRYTESLGFKCGVYLNGVYAPNLYVYSRSIQQLSGGRTKPNVPLYDTYLETGIQCALSVTVARTLDDLMRVVNIRSAVYVSEQEAPYDEEYDGNDFSATHLLGYVDKEPAGCLRIRYFADFAKLERLAVLKKFRHTRLAFLLVRAGIELCRKKGYRKLYGHAQKRLVNFWSRFGFRVLHSGKEFVFADFDYVEMVADTEQHSEPIRIGIDPYVIIRPEGRWHVPGVLERSAIRPVTRPSVF